MTTIPRYLDPRNDIPFKKVFGQHKHLCISLLNSLLPLEGREIIEIEYLPLASLPRIDSFRTSILDVRCEDSTGRQFLVEMQLYWTDSFTNRVTFNASKAYIAQFDKEDLKNKVDEMGKTKPYLRKNIYKDIQPVYSLNLINDSFENTPEMAKEYYHHYAVVNLQHTEKRIEGLELIFVELPKFKPSGRAEPSCTNCGCATSKPLLLSPPSRLLLPRRSAPRHARLEPPKSPPKSLLNPPASTPPKSRNFNTKPNRFHFLP